LASGSDHGCNSIILWDTDNWSPKLKLEGHKAAVTCILDLGDGVHIASGSYDKKINVYSLLQGKVAYNLPTNKSSVTGIVLSSRGTKMVSCGLDNSLNVWQIVRNKQSLVETMFLERIIQNNTMICSFVGSVLQDNLMYIGTKDGKIKLINIEKG
jgi:WD40 repeat protein